MFGIYSRLVKRFRKPRPYGAIILESTSRCNLLCTTCPRLSYDYKPQDMTLETYNRVVPQFKNYYNVDLTGWGEPLLNSNIFEMVRMAREQGCIVGFICNGMLLDEKRGRELLKAQINWLDISIDGATNESYKGIRIGGSLERVTENVRNFIRMRSEYRNNGYAGPFMNTTLVLSIDNLTELPGFVNLAADIGFDRVHIKNLDVVSKEEDVTRLVYPFSDEVEVDFSAVQSYLEEAGKVARQRNIPVLLPSVKPNLRHICNPMKLDSIYITATGLVAPCVNMGNPTPRMVPGGGIIEDTSLYFGNVNEDDWDVIFARYKEFRASFEEGRVPDACRHCQLLRESEYEQA